MSLVLKCKSKLKKKKKLTWKTKQIKFVWKGPNSKDQDPKLQRSKWSLRSKKWNELKILLMLQIRLFLFQNQKIQIVVIKVKMEINCLILILVRVIQMRFMILFISSNVLFLNKKLKANQRLRKEKFRRKSNLTIQNCSLSKRS